MRMEDIDPVRCRPEFSRAALEDLRWAGLDWDEGPDIGGPFAPYEQSQRIAHFRAAFERLKVSGRVFPCMCSRRDVAAAALAPHAEDAEPFYPGTCRERPVGQKGEPVSWRFRVPDSEPIRFTDGRMGEQRFLSGRNFGDFIVWRRDDAPAYELAVVVDDADMRITEVVRGEDLLLSTARQLLLYRALGLAPPRFYHCELITDEHGKRLAKRHDALSLRELRARGVKPDELSQLPVS